MDASQYFEKEELRPSTEKCTVGDTNVDVVSNDLSCKLLADKEWRGLSCNSPRHPLHSKAGIHTIIDDDVYVGLCLCFKSLKNILFTFKNFDDFLVVASF